jgi:plasmid stabilization system protein ParE
MGAKLLFTAETHEDLDDAFEWYERRRRGLGEEFLLEVATCIDSICEHPDQRAKVVDEYRQAIVHRFPYSVIYGYDGRFVTIYAVVHNARDPQRWRQRLS